MITQPEILNPANSTQDENSPDALLQYHHRGTGKVARLPKAIRDQINEMLRDGVPYAEIIQKLGDPGKDLNVDNIGEWKKRGYRDWLIQRDWLDQVTSNSAFSIEVLTAPETSSLHEAGLRLAASQMFDQLMRFNAALHSSNSLDSTDTSENFARLVNALSRLNRAALSFKKYADFRADIKERQVHPLDPKQKIAAEQTAALAQLFDRQFQMTHPDFLRADQNQPVSLPLPKRAGRGEGEQAPANLELTHHTSGS